MNGLIDDNFIAELNYMEMLRPSGEPTSLYFVEDIKSIEEPHIRIALEQAKHYKAQAVFFRIFPTGDKRSPIPQIYIYRDTSLCSSRQEFYAGIHRRLWNAGIVPLVFIIAADQVKILNCRQEPNVDKGTQNPVYSPFERLEQLVAIDRTFLTREIAAGTFWENPSFKNDFILEKTAYYKLLSHLKDFREELLQLRILSEPTVNRVLVMAILVKYLNDRKDSSDNRVFPQGFFRKFSATNSDDLETLFREQASCINLFDHLSEHFNGGIFVLTPGEKNELAQADLSRIADFLKGDQDPSGQGLFWPLYSFDDLPVELISNIYEEFLAKKEKGVVYTPPMLVDVLLDQCLPLSAETLSWKILDPACGSGIFLVGAFKRLIQCWRIANNWEKPTYRDLQGILKQSIFGFDKSPEAILVTAFSLCVALCDELDPLVIWNKLKFDNLQNRNLLGKDFFELVESGEFDNYFDLIIGNPPFESIQTSKAAIRVETAAVKSKGRPCLPDKQLALLFLDQSFRLARNESAVCLIQPAGPLLYNGNALQFRAYLFEQFAINQVFDFTPLEGVLFSKAQVAAAAIIGYNAPASTDKILHVTFRRTRAIKEKLLFELDPYDFHWITRKSVSKNQYAWKANLLGGGRLHRLLDRLFHNIPSLGKYLEHKRKNDNWQFGEGYTEGSASKLNKLSNVDELTRLNPHILRQEYKLKSVPNLAGWLTGKSNVSAKALSRHGVNWNYVKPSNLRFFHRTCSSIKSIFLPPHVLIKKIVDESSIPSVFSDKELVFSKRLIGIHAPQNDSDKLQALATRLNDSHLYGILVAILSSEMLVGRASSLLKSDILALPYPDDTQSIELNNWEQALIDDISNYLVGFRRSGENASVLTKANKSDLCTFGEMYCSILNPVYKEFRPLQPIPMDSFVCYPFCYGEAPQIDLPDKNKAVPFLNDLLQHHPHGSRLFVNRILRLYDHNVIFMIKPNQKRYWLRSIALRDADETLIDLMEQGY